MYQTNRMSLAAVASVTLIACGCADSSSTVFLDVATTTSVKNSGLLESILPSFDDATVRVHAAGSGRALAMLADEIVDLVITHAPAAERRSLAAHPNWRYQKFAFNRFVIVGPPEDPAGVGRASDAADAFRRIAASPLPFVSRGDQSGTHERELELWRKAGSRPSGDRLIVSGASMAVALRHADERQGYTLSDEATFRQFESQLDLVGLVSDEPALLNTYAVVYRGESALAARFAEWLTAGDGRRRVSLHRVGGASAFNIWPEGCRGDEPEARPCVAAPQKHQR